MVEVHVDNIYEYNEEADKPSPILSKYDGNASVYINGQTPVITFSQDEAIFRSSQLNVFCW